MPEVLLVVSRWIAVFVLAVSIALIVVRWKFPRQSQPAGSTLGYWRSVWRLMRKWRDQSRERELDARALRGRSVLVIDPDERSSRVLVWRLEALGCAVTKARTGTRGLELLISTKPAIVIADALLPDMPAADIYDHVAEAGVPIVFIGAMRAQRTELDRLSGNAICLGKPLDPDDAVAAAGRLLRCPGA